MGKRVKKGFREAWEDDEWGRNEEYSRKRNDKNKKQRQKARKQKFSNRWYDEDMNLKRKK